MTNMVYCQLCEYFKSTPNATTSRAKYLLESQMNEHIRHVQNDAMHEWNDKSFEEICSRMENMLRNRVDMTEPRRCFNCEEEKAAGQPLDIVFDGLSNQKNMHSLNVQKRGELQWGDSVEAMKSVK